VFTPATFVGYSLDGAAGGIAATVGIFLPAFLLVGVTGRVIAWVRRSPSARAVLDGVNAGSVALMAVVTIQSARTALGGVAGIVLSLASFAVLLAGVNSAWLVAGGTLAGLLLS
jgi:chromate transporter